MLLSVAEIALLTAINTLCNFEVASLIKGSNFILLFYRLCCTVSMRKKTYAKKKRGK
jgi:hypothetical protein